MITKYKSKAYYVGASFFTKEGDVIKVIGKSSTKPDYFWVVFQDKYKYIKEVFRGSLNTGHIKNPYHKSLHGVGYLGVGTYLSKASGKRSNAAQLWNSIITRCYSEKQLVKHPAYKDVTVCEEWHNFQNFAKWFHENGGPEYVKKGYQLDKDLLSEDKKIYSPETCTFLPREVNNFLQSNTLNLNNTSGYAGVVRDKYSNVWYASINEFQGKKRTIFR